MLFLYALTAIDVVVVVVIEDADEGWLKSVHIGSGRRG